MKTKFLYLVFFISCLLGAICAKNDTNDHGIVGELGKKYINIVDFQTSRIYRFQFNSTSKIPASVRLSLYGEKLDANFPVFATVRQRDTAEIMKLTGYSKGNESLAPGYLNRTIMITKDPVSSILMKRTKKIEVIIEISTLNLLHTKFEMILDANDHFEIPLGEKVSTSVDNFSPRVFRSVFNEESLKYQKLKLVSKQDICMTVHVSKNFPKFNSDTGRVERSSDTVTMTADLLAGYTVTREEDYQEEFFVTIELSPSDYICGNVNEQLAQREKVVEISLTGILTDERINIVFGSFVAFCLVVSIFTSVATRIFSGKHDSDTHYVNLSVQESTEDDDPNAGTGGDFARNQHSPSVGHNNEGIGQSWIPENPTAPPSTNNTQDQVPIGPGYANLSQMKQEYEQQRYERAMQIDQSPSQSQSVVPYQPPTFISSEQDETVMTQENQHQQEILLPQVSDQIVEDSHSLHFLSLGIFFAVPVVQSLISKISILDQENVIRDQDVCFQNFLCSVPFRDIQDFNHLISNSGFIFFGVTIYLLSSSSNRKNVAEMGIPSQNSFYQILGISSSLAGIMSMWYHVCPSRNNLQFDVVFIYISMIVIILKNYSITKGAFSSKILNLSLISTLTLTFCGIFMVSKIFAAILSSLMVIAFPVINFGLFYFGETDLVAELGNIRLMKPRKLGQPFIWSLSLIQCSTIVIGICLSYVDKVSYHSTLVLVLLESVFASGSFTYGKIFKKCGADFGSSKKTFIGLLLLVGSGVLWLAAVGFYLFGRSYDVELTPAHSRRINTDCELFNFFDFHDLWHILASIAFLLLFLGLKALDESLQGIPRTEILESFA